ncbi:metallophosphoesterase [Methanobrevibacter millerae]|uniref:Phosphoesterase n=1 Tax=Methanobrevibacter millerae TaxID=230361 RepID=A0A1G5VZG0_9EURY|nr:metallophosphoesterase [Methanobrevibacter millerae]SDA51233.1 hypothetical protein SAMN02910315_01048 [Methanobrevibacter millerae]
MLVGLISDTHITQKRGKLSEKIVKEFNGVDLILHAGDITTYDVLNDLKKIAPVVAVLGNNDKLDLNKHEIIEIGDKTILLVHGDKIKDLPALGLKYGEDIVVSGHTHKPSCERIDNMLLINPGSSNRPIESNASIALLKINDEVDVEFIDL